MIFQCQYIILDRKFRRLLPFALLLLLRLPLFPLFPSSNDALPMSVLLSLSLLLLMLRLQMCVAFELLLHFCHRPLTMPAVVAAAAAAAVLLDDVAVVVH